MSSLNARGNWKFQKSTAEVTSSGVAGGGTGTKSRVRVFFPVVILIQLIVPVRPTLYTFKQTPDQRYAIF